MMSTRSRLWWSSAFMLTLSVTLRSAVASEDWGYEGPHGPEHWPGVCTTGHSQSPINIDTKNTSYRIENPLQFLGYELIPANMTIKNNGHTITLMLDPKKPDMRPIVTGGGLTNRYAFAQMHFHWGTNSTDKGAEHTVDDKTYPMELHLVHYNLKYGRDIATAVASSKGASDTLAVVGVIFELADKDNEALNPIIELLGNVTEADSDVNVPHSFALKSLLPKDTLEWYRYLGSLTTPGCDEMVIWTVMKAIVPISADQLQQFIEVSGENEGMLNNFRPPQPLFNRTVFHMDGRRTAHKPSSAPALAASVVLCLAPVAAALAGWR